MKRIFFLSLIALVFLSSNSQASEYKDFKGFVEAYVRNFENKNNGMIYTVKFAENNGQGLLRFTVSETHCDGNKVDSTITFKEIWANKANDQWKVTNVKDTKDSAVPRNCNEKAVSYDFTKAKSGDEVWKELDETMNPKTTVVEIDPLFQMCKTEIEKKVKLSQPMLDSYVDDLERKEPWTFIQDISVVNDSGQSEEVRMSCKVDNSKVEKLRIGETVYTF